MSTELESWLDELGLGQYAASFAANAIDFDGVTDLTDANLIQLGVAPLGHRKRLLNAIAGIHRARIDNFVVGLDPPPPPARRSRRKAERRQVSVLFCDIVGSTALAHRLDPEELAPIFERYHGTTSETVRQMGGHVARFVGDGVMAYFGWPTSREDDAERAVATGLELIEAASRLSTSDGETLAVRVGVATGLVVIGYGTEAGDGGIAGETPNVAARLQAEAEPNTLVIAPLTARLAGRSFRYKSLGKRVIRGLAEPMEILEVSGTRSSLNRFEALRDRSAAALVGRNEEVQLLLSRWRRATDFEGQIVLLSGDAGIGKSRVVQTTCERIGPEAAVLRYQCSPFHQDTALFPVLQQIVRSIGLVDGQATEEKLARAQQWLQSAELDGRPSGVALPSPADQVAGPPAAGRLAATDPRTLGCPAAEALHVCHENQPGIGHRRGRAVDRPDDGGSADRRSRQHRGFTRDGPGDQPGRFLASLKPSRFFSSCTVSLPRCAASACAVGWCSIAPFSSTPLIIRYLISASLISITW